MAARQWPQGHRRRGEDYGTDDMAAARRMPKTTTTAVEAISTTAFPSPSTISDTTVFHGVLLGRLKRVDIDIFPWSVNAPSCRFTQLTGAVMARATS